MQRQSLGSPAAKLHVPVDLEVDAGGKGEKGDDSDNKSEKILRSASQPEKSIHIIPFIVLFCFLVLFLASHDPSQTDLLNIGASGRISLGKGSEVGRVKEAEKSKILAIRSHRSLQETEKLAAKSEQWTRARKFGKPTKFGSN